MKLVGEGVGYETLPVPGEKAGEAGGQNGYTQPACSDRQLSKAANALGLTIPPSVANGHRALAARGVVVGPGDVRPAGAAVTVVRLADRPPASIRRS